MYLFDLTYTCESDIVLNANKNTGKQPAKLSIHVLFFLKYTIEFFVYNNYVSKRVDIVSIYRLLQVLLSLIITS